MPLESHQRISIRTKNKKSSVERPNTDRIRERVRAILKREKDESGKKIIQETRDKLKEFLKQMKPKDAPDKEERGSRESDLRYTGIGMSSVKNEEGTMNMRVIGPKFGNNKGEIALGAMYSSQKDIPSGEAEGQIGIGLTGSFKF